MVDLQQIGRYKVEKVIAVGAMATIYQATDPKTGRKVALKVLSRELSQAPAYRQRFENEARIIAALEHRYIIPVFDFGESNHQLYLVMRYMPGGNLADRIQQGMLLLTESARILESVAAALHYAHQEGVIHRDLKPSNILFDRFGEVALSDFGLARMTLEPNRLTIYGSGIMGTPQYMSPEVWGEAEATAQSDIYSLGVILFEMLTGFLPYHSDKALQLMQMHLTAPIPNILALRPDLPQGIQPIILKALAKNPQERYTSLSDFIQAWREAVKIDPAQAFLDPMASSLYPDEDRFLLLGSPRPSPSARHSPSIPNSSSTKTKLSLPAWVLVTLTAACGLIVAASVGSVWFWTSLSATQVPSQKTLPAAAARAQDAPMGGLKTESQPVANLTPSGSASLTPTDAPVKETPEEKATAAPTLRWTPTPTVLPTPILRTSKDLAVVINGTIYLFDFSRELLQVTKTNDNEFPSFSPDAKRLAFSSNRFGNHDIYLINADGSGTLRLTDGKADNLQPSSSPDGTRIAFTSNRDGNKEIYLEGVFTSGLVRLTNHPAEDHSPTWSPDGKRIAFVSRRDGNPEIYVMDSRGENLINLTNDPAEDMSPTWSPDGKKIAFVSGGRIFLSTLDGKENTLVTLPGPLRKEHFLRSPAWSPDGSRLAFIKFLDGDIKASDLCVLELTPAPQVERCYDYVSRKFSGVSWNR